MSFIQTLIRQKMAEQNLTEESLGLSLGYEKPHQGIFRLRDVLQADFSVKPPKNKHQLAIARITKSLKIPEQEVADALSAADRKWRFVSRKIIFKNYIDRIEKLLFAHWFKVLFENQGMILANSAWALYKPQHTRVTTKYFSGSFNLHHIFHLNQKFPLQNACEMCGGKIFFSNLSAQNRKSCTAHCTACFQIQNIDEPELSCIDLIRECAKLDQNYSKSSIKQAESLYEILKNLGTMNDKEKLVQFYAPFYQPQLPDKSRAVAVYKILLDMENTDEGKKKIENEFSEFIGESNST